MMQSWFPQAKLGIFLHWGIYAVKGVPESWAFFNEQMSYADYMAQCDGFTAHDYKPREWAALIQRTGARYAVLTTKHHDGVALFDTQQSALSVAQRTPAGRDLIAPWCDALREQGLKVGLYFSHLDWSAPDYCPIPPAARTGRTTGPSFAQWSDGAANPTWQRFLKFHRAQLEELCTGYGDLDLLWFDGDWTPARDWWRFAELKEQLGRWQPKAIVNSRMGGQGDYDTPEQGIPITRPEGPWELCVTMNDSWGYKPHDQNYKSTRQIVRMLCECISMGGNLLLDITPKEDGTIPAEQVERLEALGDWTRRHAEAIFPTVAGLPVGHLYGASALSADSQTLYVFLFDRPWDEFALKGIRNSIRRVSVVGSGTELGHRKLGGASWMNIPGVLWIDVPEAELNPLATVLKIELEGPLDLYRGAGHAIEHNE